MEDSLVVIGTGIQYGSHITAQTEWFIREADKLLYVIPGPWVDEWMKSLNETAESLIHLYGDNKCRPDTDRQMVDTTILWLKCVKP